MSGISEKAKTFAELFTEYARWKNLFKMGVMGNQQAYNEARDTRKYFEEQKWVRVSVAQQEIDRLKILILKYNNEVVEYEQKVERERDEQKQKLRDHVKALPSGLIEVGGITVGNLLLLKQWFDTLEELLK